MTDVLLTSDYDLQIENGDFMLGESLTQEVALILLTNQGEWKEDPILGATLVRKLKANAGGHEVEQMVKLQLGRDGKNYDDIKENIKINTDEST